MENLLKETLEVLKRNGKSSLDIVWIGSADGKFALSNDFELDAWAQFIKMADFEYEDGYGGVVVSADLVIVGADWWLERMEYDTSEWWVFKSLPVKQEGAKSFEAVKDTYSVGASIQ